MLRTLARGGDRSGSDGTAVERHGGPGRSGIDRRFPPPGVKAVPSYGCPPFRRGVAHAGGALVWQPQNCTIRGRSPRRCGRGYSWKAALDVGWHGFPESSAVKRSAAPACVVPGGKDIEPAKNPALGTAEPRQRTSRPQLAHWQRRAPGGPWPLPPCPTRGTSRLPAGRRFRAESIRSDSTSDASIRNCSVRP